jgi:hypothetical protein
LRTRSSIAIVFCSSALSLVSARSALAACGSYPLPETGAYNSQFSGLDNYVQQWVQANQVSAATLALTYDKKLVYERGFGYQDSACTEQILPDARMRLATNSTPMTRRALQQLISDGALSPTTNVQRYLNGFFSLPPSPDPRMQEIRVEDIYDFLTCTSDANSVTNVQAGQNMGLGRPATATERIQYIWANPQYAMPTSLACPPGSGSGTCTYTAGCTPGSAFTNPDGSYQNGFSHVSHEIAGAIIAAAYYKNQGHSKYNDPSLTSATGVANWYGSYENSVVGRHVGAQLFQASDDYAGAPGSALPNEIWYDSAGGTACPEWNYWACALTNPPTQAPVPAAYATDYYARPGSGTIVASGRDVTRFMNSYYWANNDSTLPNSSTQLQKLGWGCCTGGALPGTTTLMGDGETPYGGEYHFWDWVLLANRDNVNTSFNIGSLLDNGSSGVFNTSQPAEDLYVDSLIYNRWGGQYAYVPYSSAPRVDYDTATQASSNPYFPYSALPGLSWLWRIQPDSSGYYRFTNEEMSFLMLSNQDDYQYVELLAPNTTWWSEEWSLVPAPDAGWTQIVARWDSPNALNVQDQTGYVEQGPIQSTWWSAEWQMDEVPSGLCCTNLTSSVSCPCGSQACLCGSSGCPAYTP